MSLQPALFATKVVSEHEVQIFYRADELPGSFRPTLTLGDMAAGHGIPDDQRAAFEGRYGNTSVWKPASSGEVGRDFHRHIREIIGGKRPDLATSWVLTDFTRTFLDQASLYESQVDPALRVKKRLILALTDASRRRLEQHAILGTELLVNVRDVALTIFATRHAFASAVIEFNRADRAALSALELLEAQILVARLGKVAWIDAASGLPVSGAPFVLGDLIRQLAFGKLEGRSSQRRITTYAYARLGQPSSVQERDLFALHLARHYTTDYAISSHIGGVAFVADFDTVRHAVALEGSATIVGTSDDAPLPAFLQDFRTATFRRHYVPVALLARHEHAFLVQRTSASVISEEDMKDRMRTVQRLQELRRQSFFFRLSYRYSELSFVSMHNALNRAFRQVLHLDRMLEELGSDIVAVEGYLRAEEEAEHRRHEERKHRRYYWTTVLGASSLAGLTAFTIAKEITELAFPDKPMEIMHHWFALGSIGVGFLAFIGGILVGLLKGPGKPHEEHAHGFAEHAMVEHMMDAARKKTGVDR